jgi:hypothetical protein
MATNSRFVRVYEWSIVTDNSTQRLNPCRKCFFRPVLSYIFRQLGGKIASFSDKRGGSGTIKEQVTRQSQEGRSGSLKGGGGWREI